MGCEEALCEPGGVGVQAWRSGPPERWAQPASFSTRSSLPTRLCTALRRNLCTARERVALCYAIRTVRGLLRAQGRQPLPWSFHQLRLPDDVRPFSRPYRKPCTHKRHPSGPAPQRLASANLHCASGSTCGVCISTFLGTHCAEPRMGVLEPLGDSSRTLF